MQTTRGKNSRKAESDDSTVAASDDTRDEESIHAGRHR